MKIYVASSFRNDHLDDVVKGLREDGHEVYDFRENGFEWRQAFAEAGFVELTRRASAPNIYAEKADHVLNQISVLASKANLGPGETWQRRFGMSQDELEKALRVGFTPPEDGHRASAKEWHMATHTPTAGEAFARDYKALQACEALVLVLPAGRSAHLEAGFAAARVTVHIYQPGLERPDLMNRMIESNGGKVFGSLDELRDEMLPGSRYDKATERAARIVERSGLREPDVMKRLADRIRDSKGRGG